MSATPGDPLAAIEAIPRELLPSALARLASRLLAPAPGAATPAPNATPDASKLLTPQEVASRLGVKVRYVYRNAKKLGGVRFGLRTLRFPEAALERELAKRRASQP
ncbi:MAG: helix-turn-helix domain-containing protein [Gemmatimonadaceae bacterium]